MRETNFGGLLTTLDASAVSQFVFSGNLSQQQEDNLSLLL